MSTNISLRHQNFVFQGTNKQELRSVIKEVFKEHVYFIESSELNDQPVVVDIGAHVGVATLYFSMILPNSKIYSVEPNPVSFELLKKNTTTNRVEAELFPVAIIPGTSLTQQKIPVFVDTAESEQWLSNASLLEGSWTHREDTTKIVVDGWTLSRLFQEIDEDQIDFLKIDIEGGEHDLIASTTTEVLQKVHHLMIEMHPTSVFIFEETSQQLEKKGFELLGEFPTKKERSRLWVAHFARR